MATKPETTFRKKVRFDLTALGVNRRLWFEGIQQRAIKGTPDFVICANGYFIGLELKSESGILSHVQEAKHRCILAANGVVLVASPKNWKNILKTIAFYMREDPDDRQ